MVIFNDDVISLSVNFHDSYDVCNVLMNSLHGSKCQEDFPLVREHRGIFLPIGAWGCSALPSLLLRYYFAVPSLFLRFKYTLIGEIAEK